MNVFTRRKTGAATIGEIIDIDILGPDNGSVVLVESQSNYFVFQTVDSDAMGCHPENGAREFGFERVNTRVRFYTRGVSRPGNFLVRQAGATPQKRSWTGLITGILKGIAQSGGKVSGGVEIFKEERPQ